MTQKTRRLREDGAQSFPIGLKANVLSRWALGLVSQDLMQPPSGHSAFKPPSPHSHRHKVPLVATLAFLLQSLTSLVPKQIFCRNRAISDWSGEHLPIMCNARTFKTRSPYFSRSNTQQEYPPTYESSSRRERTEQSPAGRRRSNEDTPR